MLIYLEVSSGIQAEVSKEGQATLHTTLCPREAPYYFSCCCHKIPDEEGRVCPGSQLRGRVHHCREAMAARAWSCWSHCAHRQEAERAECWCSAYFLLLAALGCVIPPQLTRSRNLSRACPEVWYRFIEMSYCTLEIEFMCKNRVFATLRWPRIILLCVFANIKSL